MFIDTHTHMYSDSLKKDRNLVMSRAVDSGVDIMLLPNIDLESVEDVHGLYEAFPQNTRPMLGLHPCHVRSDWKSEVDSIFSHLDSGRPYCAVGEIGIDLHWNETYQAEQQEALLYQCEYAARADLPVVIHSRSSMDLILDILERESIAGLRGVFHCFGGTPKQLERVLNLDFYIGLGGTITYKNTNYSEILSHDHLDRIVLETDAPYLPPVPYRGKRNESSYLVLVAKRLADILSLPMEIIAQRTTLAAHELFRLG